MKRSTLSGLLLILVWPLSVQAQMLSVDYTDQANFGFNDSTPVEPLPGNSAVTLGEQRRAALKAAIDIWASRLDSRSVVRVEALFEDIGCGEETTLGLGGSVGLARNFFNAPQPDTNYPLSLAAALRGQIFSQFDSEIRVRFNFRVDSEDCIESVSGYWYGLDPLTPPPLGTFSFLELALHELGHGLGFQSLTDREDRSFFGDPPVPDIMSDFIFDLQRDQSWTEMTAAQRVQSATSGDNLVFTGERANLAAAERLLPPGEVTLLSGGGPGTPRFTAWVQGFAPYLPLSGLAAELALAQGPGPGPGASDPWHRSLACEPLDNADDLAGRLVLVRRGECTFALKWQNVFDAGAAGLILVDNQPAGSDNAIERDLGIAVDRNLPIPIWLVADATGNSLRQALPDASVRLGYDSSAPARGTNEGFVNLQADTENTDSNVSHFATSLLPSSLMNPSITNRAFNGDLDIVPGLLEDLGWIDSSAKRAQFTGNWFNPSRSGEGCQLTFDGGQDIPVLTCYLYRDGEPFWLIGNGDDLLDRIEFNEMVITSGTGYGSQFDPAEVVLDNWGRIVMRPIDCNQARFDFLPEDQGLPDFASQMQRIVPGPCNQRASQQNNRSRTGNYFDPQRSGEGIQLSTEADGLTWIITFYTYRDGQQVWMIGTGNRLGNTIEFNDVVTTSGGDFGPGFDPDAIERVPFGRFVLDFDGCNDLSLTIESARPEFSSDQRNLTRIIPREC